MLNKGARTNILALVLLTRLLLSCGGGANVGKSAPAFELSNLDGNMVSMSGFKGKVVLLNFWSYT